MSLYDPRENRLGGLFFGPFELNPEGLPFPAPHGCAEGRAPCGNGWLGVSRRGLSHVFP